MNPKSRHVIKLNDSVYQLYRPAGTRSLQVVFFHGFQLEDYESAHTTTWTSGDGSVWPQTWLVEKFPEAHVLSVSYNQWVTNDRDGGTMDLFNICENLTADLLSANRPRCPIILVGHSFGGLVIKALCVHMSTQMLSERDSNTRASLEDFLNDVRGIFFYATPHRGISKEALALFTAGNQSLSEYVTTLSTPAATAEFDFFPLAEKYKWQIVGLGESQPIKKTGIHAQLVGGEDLGVTPEALSRYGWRFNIAENTNHITITRPTERTQRNFTALVGLLNSIKQKGVKLERPVYHCQGIPKYDPGSVSSREYGIPSELQPVAEKRCIVATVNDIDGLYVPINKPHSAVIKAIEDRHGPSLILLHGGVGKGKSTLARSMMQRYGIQKDITDGKAFDSVVWVSCGNCSRDEISTKQLEILKNHSPNSLADSRLEDLEEKTNLRQRIAEACQEFFDDKKILMILDDVSDDGFLYEMWDAATGGKASAGGKGVKILVTSQWRDICVRAGLKANSCLIFMEDPMEDEAMKILASHVGLERKCIPHHLQPTAKQMIKVIERNPLALACLASSFAYSEDIEDQQAWQDALRRLYKLLGNPEERLVLPVPIPAEKHIDPKRLFGVMKICINSLKIDDAKKILFFMYAFKEESTPELVLRILHGSLRRSNCTFSKSRDELRMRELLTLHQEPQQPPSLSLRSLVRLYMEHTKMVGDNEIKSLIDELFHDVEQAPESSNAEIKQGDETGGVEWEKARVAITLCALYFNRHNASMNKILAEAITRANVTYSNDDINDLRREAIYPILSLMDEPESEHLKESDVSSTRQVFLTYICKRKLDNENISHLLELAASTAAQLATLKAIGQICTVEKEPLLKDNNFNFLHPLVHLLDANRGLPTSLLEEASKTLLRVCWKAGQDQSTSRVTNMPGVLDMLVNLISFPIQWPSVVAENAAKALWVLFYSGGICKTANFAILEEKGALINLAKCLSEHGNPSLQRGAAGALGALAYNANSSLKVRIANHEGVVHSLVKLMSSRETLADVRVNATRALRNLASATDNVLKLQIVNEEGALEGLVKLMSMHDMPETQEHAAASLGNLASNADRSLALRIANHEGVLHSLVKLMSSRETLADVRVNATRALRNLASATDNVLKLQIVNEEGALEGLVKLMSMHDMPETQEHAAASLGNLASNADRSLALRIANHEGVLHSLVKLMSSRETLADVRVNATRALRNLASATDNVLKLQIVNEEGALEGLVKLMSMHDMPETQEHAAASLGNLASNADRSLALRIANHEGVLHSLVHLTSSNETLADVRVNATRALRNLASATDNVLKLQIVNEEGALEGLVKLMSMHDMPETQEHAAASLGNLASNADRSLALRIANHEGVLHSLVKLMSSRETLADVRVNATRALRNLASATDNVLKLQIVNEEGALEGLVKLMSMHDMPETQEHAAASLGNLASNADRSLALRIANHEGVLHSLVHLTSSNETLADVRVEATRALQNLALSSLHRELKTLTIDKEVFHDLSANKSLLQGHLQLGIHNIPSGDESRIAVRGEGARDEVLYHHQVSETDPGPAAEEFVRELREGGQDGYFVSSMWLRGLEELERKSVMSALWTAGYSEICQTSTTILFAIVENGTQHLNDASQISGSTEKGGDTLLGTARKGSSIDEITDCTDVFRRKDLGESSGSIEHITSAETRKLFEAVKRETHQSFCVSTQLLTSLKDHEKQALVPILREAGYEMTFQTRTTTWYEKIRGQVQNPAGGQCSSSRSSQKCDFSSGNAEYSIMSFFGSLGWKGKMDDKDDAGDSSGVANMVGTKRTKGGSQSTCKPQYLRIKCLSSLLMQEPLIPNGEDNKRRQFGNLNVTMPATGQFKTISTTVDKNFSIQVNRFSSDGRPREVSDIVLNAMATTTLSCCCKIDDDSWKMRIKFSRITGEVKNEGSDKELCNAMVISSFCTGVNAWIKNGENHPGERINLDVRPRQVSATAQQLEGNSEQIPQVPVLCEDSGRTARGQAPSPRTIALLTDIGKRRRENFRRRSYGIHPLHFEDTKSPIVFEGDIESGDIQPESFFEFHIRYLLDVSYYRPCSPFSEGPTCPAYNSTEEIDFNCCFEIRIDDPWFNQSM